ncbi:unnamed protein product [Cuscuta epithymum]|uniref:Transmembrane protein n=1 Tax=Cuscuta epithymum TaxID=186058 RepID=A0AAV0CCT8_9ASTE|nr:unnamed protein product [Cuscuta epithymum]
MYEFGEELLIESYKVPWLIWIQLLVMVLLFLLLFFGFSVFSLDLSNNSASTSGAGGSSFSAGSDNGFGDGRQAHRTEQGQDGNHHNEASVEASISTDVIRREERDNGSSFVKDELHHSRPPGHPCHFLGVAKQAFLKCLGLDCCSGSPNNRKHGKED